MRNFLLTIVSIFLALILLEIASSEYIKKKKETIESLLPKEARLFYEKFYKDLHHLRGFMPFQGAIQPWGLKSTPSNAMFTTIRNFNTSHENILIQGDSWGEQFILNKLSKDLIIKISEEVNIGLVVAGTSSYSFSPMEVQLGILRSDFHLNPTHVVTIVDHTDIGDELCRYKDRINLNDSKHPIRVNPEPYLSKKVYSLQYFFRKNSIIFSSKYNIIKLIKMGKLELSRKFFSEKEKCGWGKIARPLIEGLDSIEENYFKERMESYIDSAFADSSLLHVTFVIHPHLRHLENSVGNGYTLYLAEIMKSVIQESVHKEKVDIIDFKKLLPNPYAKEGLTVPKDIFVEGDLGSHLNDKAHSIYTQFIAKHVKLKIEKLQGENLLYSSKNPKNATINSFGIP